MYIYIHKHTHMILPPTYCSCRSPSSHANRLNVCSLNPSEKPVTSFKSFTTFCLNMQCAVTMLQHVHWYSYMKMAALTFKLHKLWVLVPGDDGQTSKHVGGNIEYIYNFFFFTFVGPRIVIYFDSKTNKRHNISNLFYFGNNTVHVSGGPSVHH
jgi:hypothetical protein